jgi:hypothetical protein
VEQKHRQTLIEKETKIQTAEMKLLRAVKGFTRTDKTQKNYTYTERVKVKHCMNTNKR